MGKIWSREKVKQASKREQTEKAPSRALLLLKAMAVAYAITCCVFILCGILLTYTALSEQTIPVISLLTTALCAGVAGFDWAKSAEKRGIFWGLAAGIVYGVLLCAICSWGSGAFLLKSWSMPLVAAAGGCIGGIIGINFQK